MTSPDDLCQNFSPAAQNEPQFPFRNHQMTSYMVQNFSPAAQNEPSFSIRNHQVTSPVFKIFRLRRKMNLKVLNSPLEMREIEAHFAPQAKFFEYRVAISRGKLRFILRRRRKILNHIGGHLMISKGKLWFILRRRRKILAEVIWGGHLRS